MYYTQFGTSKHGRHQESEAGGNVGAKARAQWAMDIGVWGLWALMSTSFIRRNHS